MKLIIFLTFLFPLFSFAGEVSTGGGVRPKLDANVAPQFAEYIKSVRALPNGSLQIKYKNSLSEQVENHIVNDIDLHPEELEAIRKSFLTRKWQAIQKQN